jgi:hypothetical protein
MAVDLLINEQYSLVFSKNGDLLTTDFEIESDYQDLSILLNIDTGHNKQFPELGVAIYKSINGNEKELFSSIIDNAKRCAITIKDIYIDNNGLLQIEL